MREETANLCVLFCGGCCSRLPSGLAWAVEMHLLTVLEAGNLRSRHGSSLLGRTLFLTLVSFASHHLSLCVSVSCSLRVRTPVTLGYGLLQPHFNFVLSAETLALNSHILRHGVLGLIIRTRGMIQPMIPDPEPGKTKRGPFYRRWQQGTGDRGQRSPGAS